MLFKTKDTVLGTNPDQASKALLLLWERLTMTVVGVTRYLTRRYITAVSVVPVILAEVPTLASIG
jgi:hypothetical protein